MSISELGVRVVEGVFVVLGCDLGEVLGLCAEHFHVLETSIAEHERSEGFHWFGSWVEFDGLLEEMLNGAGSVLEGSCE